MALQAPGADAQEITFVVSRATPAEPRHQAGTIQPLGDGTLLLAYSHFYAGLARDNGAAHIVGRRSHDHGQTWSEPFELQANIGQINCMTPSLLRLPSGRLLLEFMRKDAEHRTGGIADPTQGLPGLLYPMVKHSDDDGETWSEPRQIPAEDDYWCSCHDRLFRSSSGRVLLPMSTRVGAFCWFSDDEGQTWRMSAQPIMAPEELQGYTEPIVAQMNDGRLKMWLRNKGRRFHVAISDDDGDSWTLHSRWGPNARSAPCMVRRIADTGDLLILWNNNQVRTPLTAAISKDEGETWTHIRDLEPMRHWPPKITHSYPSLVFSGGYAHITYYESEIQGDASDAVHAGALMSLKYRRLPVSWFYET